MKPMQLNLSQMKKVASDKKTTSLKHPDGHVIVIMHSALPHLTRKALEKLPFHEEESEKPKKMALGGLAGNPLITSVPARPLPVQAAFPQIQVSTAGPQIAAAAPMMDLGDWSGIKSKDNSESDAKPASTGDSGLDIKLDSAFNNADTASEAVSAPSDLSGAFEQTLAEGGEVKKPESKPKEKPNFGKVIVKEDPKPNYGKVKYSKNYDAGGEVKDGPGDKALKSASHSLVPDDPAPEKSAESGSGGLAKSISDYFKAKGGKIESCMHCGGVPRKYYDEGGKTTSEPTDASDDKSTSEPTDVPADTSAADQTSNPNHITINVGQPTQTAPGTQTIPAIANAPARANTAPIETQQAPTATYSTAGGITTPAQNEKLAEQQLQEAGKENVGIQSEEAKLAAERAKGTIQGIKEIQDQHAANVAEVQKPVQDFAEHIATKPADADRYLNNMSGGKKIRTAIGLFLGGLSVPFGGQNTTLDMLNKAIDRDVEEQKRETGNKQTLFNAYFHLYGNKELAANAAKQSLMDIVAQRANIDAARLRTPTALNNNKILQATAAQSKNDLSLKNGAILGNTKGQEGQTKPQQQESQPTEGNKPEVVPSPPSIHDQQKLYAERNLRPGSKEIPYTPPPQLIKVDYDAINNHKRNKELGLLNSMDEGEVTQADRESKDAESANQALKEIHKQYQVLWKNGGDADILGNFLSDQHVAGFKLPDLSKLTPSQRAYYTAAAAVEKQIGNAIKGGLNEHVTGLIQDQLPHKNDTPEQYREKLMNLDDILRQPLGGGVLRRRKLATGLPE